MIYAAPNLRKCCVIVSYFSKQRTTRVDNSVVLNKFYFHMVTTPVH